MEKRFWISVNKRPWQEVTSDQFAQIENEQRAIFKRGIVIPFKSRITYGEIKEENYRGEPDFLEAAGVKS